MSFGILSPLLNVFLNIISFCSHFWDSLTVPLGDWLRSVLGSDGLGLNLGENFFSFLNNYTLISFFFGVGFFIILLLKLVKLLPFT